ncbi:MAG TPA: hypothetical protein H9785_03190 [Candidatus Bacteroides intestinavium]|uniref:Uncharacterized protein n=1 Tax=Candidatus Bacteroides intestinavium TaxID=2838469 RepID=A0A9D2KS70_9BACE|nr:hypothetical protein [Candidatus Bacteroides intestinavium]
MTNQEHQKHIENVIKNTFEIIQDVYNHQKEKEGSLDESSKRSRIIFPNSCKGETRISEQELRFIFVEQLNKEIVAEGNAWDVYYSVETPTKGDKYCFKDKNPSYNEDGKGDPANFDLVIFDNKLQRIALIEFKANNPDEHDHQKDILKLNQSKELEGNPLRYFIEIVKNANKGTYNSLHDKINNKGEGIEFRCFSLKQGDITNQILHLEESK